MRHFLLFIYVSGLVFGQTAPTIRNITNAAIPALDSPPATIHLASRSLATIFGFGLADVTASAPSPLPTVLGGTEVHLATDSCSDISCDLVAQLIYVSDQQINFVVPENGASTPVSYRVVFIRDGKRVDRAIAAGPGRLIIDSNEHDLIFAVGSTCLFSFSENQASCNQHQAPIGAVFDAVSGQPINSGAPIRQGQLLTLWLTALSGGVMPNSTTGLLQQNNPATLRLGVAQKGQDFPATVASGPIGGFQTPVPLFAGESPQFIGLDQINVAFPTCSNVPVATSEKRYDAFFSYRNVETGNTARIYMPFLVRVGDPDCTWSTNSNTTLTSGANPSVSGSPVTLTARITPSDATGTVTFMNGTIVLADVPVASGVATFTSSQFSAGYHGIVALYNGDTNYTGSEATLTQTVNAATTTTINSSLNPSISGQAVTFNTLVYSSSNPVAPSGTVTFFDGSTMLGRVALTIAVVKPLIGSSASLTTSVLTTGTHQITALYNADVGDGYANSTSSVLVQTVNAPTPTISITYSPSSPNVGQNVTVNVSYDPTATGTITLFDGTSKIGSNTLVNGTVPFTISSISGGTHMITANYSGDTKFPATFVVSSLTVGKTATSVTVTSSANPTTYQPHGNGCTPAVPSCVTYPVYLTLTAEVSPPVSNDISGTVSFYAVTARGGSSVRIECNRGNPVYVGSNGAVCPVTGGLSTGTSSITAVYSGDTNFVGSTSTPLTQVVNMALYAFPNPAVAGQAVSFEVVTGWPWNSSGVMTLYDGSTVIGSGIVAPVNDTFSPLNGNNTVIVSTTTLGVGNHSITAVYTPTAGVTVATSQVVTETITAH